MNEALAIIRESRAKERYFGTEERIVSGAKPLRASPLLVAEKREPLETIRNVSPPPASTGEAEVVTYTVVTQEPEVVTYALERLEVMNKLEEKIDKLLADGKSRSAAEIAKAVEGKLEIVTYILEVKAKSNETLVEDDDGPDDEYYKTRRAMT